MSDDMMEFETITVVEPVTPSKPKPVDLEELYPLLRQAYPGLNVEVSRELHVPPTPKAVCIRFTSIAEFASQLSSEPHKSKQVGNGELIQVYVKSTKSEPGVYFADFARES